MDNMWYFVWGGENDKERNLKDISGLYIRNFMKIINGCFEEV